MEGYTTEDYKKMIDNLKHFVEMREGVGMIGYLEVVKYAWDSERGSWDYDHPDYRTPIGGNHNISPRAGVDMTFAQTYGSASATATAHWIALTTNTDAPATTDTTLATEITTGGLARAAGTYAHTAAQATATVKYTFTATAQFTAVQKCGLFNADAVGNLVHEATFTSTNLLTNDQIVMTWTLTNDNYT